MKTYTTLAISLLMLSACNKKVDELQTKPVVFTETRYEFIGTFDSTGKPDYLSLPSDPISQDFLSFVSTTIPEGSDLRKQNPDLLNSKAIADLNVTQSSDIYITFVAQNTGSGNAIAYYTYPTNTPPATAADIKKIFYIFPNAGSGTPLKAGNKVNIGRFEPGTSIGFVLLKGAWNTITNKLNSNNLVHFCSNDVLNPEVNADLKKHSVLVNYINEKKMLIGFEDTDRTLPICDHDFQDVVIYATTTP
jgi:hypothetical protein